MKYLAAGINVGSTKNAYVKGYNVAAKTGTAEKHGAEKEAAGNITPYVGSCVAFAPADDPQIAILIAIDTPSVGQYYGGVVAAPVVAQVLSDTLPYLNIAPELTEEEKESMAVNVSNYRSMTVAEATEKIEARGFDVKVIGKGEEYCGQWNCKLRENMPEPELSAMPSDCSEEDGKAILAEIELCGAEVVAWDAASGKPMLVRNKVGDGWVYTFTLWAYPGHEKFQSFSASWVAKLSQQALGEIYVEDETGELFWTTWQDGNTTRLFILNTDWSIKGNKKTFNVVNGKNRITLSIAERTLICVTLGEKTDIQTYKL
jgi:hypothetical protein